FHFHQALTEKIFNLGPHAIAVAAIDEPCEIFLGHRTEFAEFQHGCDFRSTKAIAAASELVDGARFDSTSRVAIWIAIRGRRSMLGNLFVRLIASGRLSGLKFSTRG